MSVSKDPSSPVCPCRKAKRCLLKWVYRDDELGTSADGYGSVGKKGGSVEEVEAPEMNKLTLKLPHGDTPNLLEIP